MALKDFFKPKTITRKHQVSSSAEAKKLEPAPGVFFEHEGKKFKVTKGAIIKFDSGSQTLTAADICTSTAAQKYLVDNKCSCIEEVIE
jgi:phage gp45-like